MKTEYLWDIAMERKPMSKSLANKIIKLLETHSWRAMVETLTEGKESNQGLGMYLENVAKKIRDREVIK